MASPCRSADEVVDALRRADIRPRIEAVLTRCVAGEVVVPPRTAVGRRDDGAVTHVMTVRDDAERLVLTKVVDYDPKRPRRDGRAASAGVLALLRDGDPVLLTSADTFTGVRTGKVAALGVDLLASPGALDVALVGPGLVGEETLRALADLRVLTRVRVVGRDVDRAAAAARRIGDHLEVEVRAVDTVREACRGATVLVTATGTVEPIVDNADLAPSVEMVAALGAGIAQRRELSSAVVAGCGTVVVDTVDGDDEEAGDLVQARADGVAPDAHSLFDVLRGDVEFRGRRLYKSVGSSWQDLACVLAALDVLGPGAKTASW